MRMLLVLVTGLITTSGHAWADPPTNLPQPNAADDEQELTGSKLILYRKQIAAEQPAIAAITALGGWVRTEKRHGFDTVIEVNMVYHEPEGGDRLNNHNYSSECLYYVPKFRNVEMLALKETQASDAGLALVRDLPHLTKVFIWDGWDVTDEGVAHLAAIPNLEYLHLSGSLVSDAGLASLSKSRSITGLSMQKSNVTDAGLEHIGKMTQLETFAIGLGDENHITDAGVAHLRPLAKLTRLGLQRTEVTLDGLRVLKGFDQLKDLWVSGPNIDQSELSQLRDQFPRLETQ